MADKDLISRSALLAEYDRVHVGPPGGARKLMEEAPAWSPWADMKYELPMDGKSYLIIVSGKPQSNITLDHAYELATWYNDSGWILDEWPEWEDTKVHAWAELPDPPEQEEDEVCEACAIRYSGGSGKVIEIRNCPCCGSCAEFREYHGDIFDKTYYVYAVVCTQCGLRTERWGSQDMAAEHWNRRVCDPE